MAIKSSTWNEETRQIEYTPTTPKKFAQKLIDHAIFSGLESWNELGVYEDVYQMLTHREIELINDQLETLHTRIRKLLQQK